MTDTCKPPPAERFWVKNSSWTYGRKLVVLATHYDAVVAQNHALESQLQIERGKTAEWERAARIARDRGRFMVVK